MIKKFPTVWEKMSENHGRDFFDSHFTTSSLNPRDP